MPGVFILGKFFQILKKLEEENRQDGTYITYNFFTFMKIVDVKWWNCEKALLKLPSLKVITKYSYQLSFR